MKLEIAPAIPAPNEWEYTIETIQQDKGSGDWKFQIWENKKNDLIVTDYTIFCSAIFCQIMSCVAQIRQLDWSIIYRTEYNKYGVFSLIIYITSGSISEKYP